MKKSRQCFLYVHLILVTHSWFVKHLLNCQELEGKVSISLDAWTSSNQYAFLAIVAHYITNDGKLGALQCIANIAPGIS